MTENEISQIIEQIDPSGKISQSAREELIASLSQFEKGNRQEGEVTPENVETKLKIMLGEESDWRKRAAIAARIISLNLE